jgi:cell division protein ZapA (FtsZ GTPase activity inhibitor)
MSKQSIAVQIAGNEYKIRSGGDADALKRIAGQVDRAMLRVRESTGTVDSLDVAVLTCLNLAREIIALREQQSGAVEDDKMRALIERVESVVRGESSSAEASQASDSSKTSDATAPAPAEEDPVPAAAAAEKPPARTLEMPNFDVLRERAQSGTADSSNLDDEGALPEARVAAGGRERAS